MKIFKYGFVGILFLLISSCQPPVVFSEPQPKGEPEVSEIPQAYHGVYWCKTDSITLVIDKNMISKQKKYESKLTVEEIESNPKLSFQNETLYSTQLDQSFPAKQMGETVIAQMTLIDTLFTNTMDEVLKLHKGHLILNSPIENNAWGVTIISLKYPDVISISKAELPDNLEDLERITTVEQFKTREDDRTVQIRISPTQAEFDQILREGLMFDGACVDFERIYPVTDLPL